MDLSSSLTWSTGSTLYSPLSGAEKNPPMIGGLAWIYPGPRKLCKSIRSSWKCSSIMVSFNLIPHFYIGYLINDMYIVLQSSIIILNNLCLLIACKLDVNWGVEISVKQKFIVLFHLKITTVQASFPVIWRKLLKMFWYLCKTHIFLILKKSA